jgi:carbonic anhydrase
MRRAARLAVGQYLPKLSRFRRHHENGGDHVSLRLVQPMPTPRGLASRKGTEHFASLVESLTSESATTHRTIEVDLDDLGLQPGEQGIPRQRPFAAALGSSDARVLIELIFNEGPNDLFVVRVAGNGLGADVLGSLRYAIEHLRDGLRLVVVLGHNGCGVKHRRRDAQRQP